MDLLPTIVNICKAKQPAKKIDGVDIMPLLKQVKDANPRDELVYYYDRNNLKCIRKGTLDPRCHLPTIPVLYPFAFNNSAIVSSSGFKAISAEGLNAPLMPMRFG